MGQIFEPYFSTKETGIGLGLALTKKLIEDHGGQIKIGLRSDIKIRRDLASSRELKIGRRYADDGVGFIVQCDLLSDDCRAGAVTLPPQPMAKDDYTISARPVFFG